MECIFVGVGVTIGQGPVERRSSFQWRHNGCDGVSHHQPYDSLLNRLYSHRSKKTSKLRVTGLCAGNSLVTGEFPAKWPVTRKMFPFGGVIMLLDMSFCLTHTAISFLSLMKHDYNNIFNSAIIPIKHATPKRPHLELNNFIDIWFCKNHILVSYNLNI